MPTIICMRDWEMYSLSVHIRIKSSHADYEMRGKSGRERDADAGMHVLWK